eukprot:6720448-Alexandrium_andersonii.AAC.1
MASRSMPGARFFRAPHLHQGRRQRVGAGAAGTSWAPRCDASVWRHAARAPRLRVGAGSACAVEGVMGSSPGASCTVSPSACSASS